MRGLLGLAARAAIDAAMNNIGVSLILVRAIGIAIGAVRSRGRDQLRRTISFEVTAS
jgi:hypothetical protein